MVYADGQFYRRWSDMLVQRAIDRNFIEKTARRSLVEKGVAKIPVNPEELAYRMGLQVKYADIPGNCTGLMNRDEKLIIVDEWLKEEDPPQARFVIAHELGHWCLEQDTETAMNSETDTDDREIAASLFARALLMPRPYVEKAIKIYNEKRKEIFHSSIEYVASLFEVPVRHARRRLEECDFV